MRAEQVSPQQAHAQRERDLGLFLENAERAFRPWQACPGIPREFEPPFEEAVAQAPKAEEWEMPPQVGVFAFRAAPGMARRGDTAPA